MKKIVTGKDLITLGYKPSKWFKEALLFINKYDLNDENIKTVCDNLINKYKKIEILDRPNPYEIFLDTNTEDEKINLAAVVRTMDEVMKSPVSISGYIMPDACPAGGIGTIPVGGVVVTNNTIHPSMHSADVCCSVATSELSKNFDVKDILDIAMKVTHFGTGGRNKFQNQYDLDNDPLYKKILNNYFTKDYIEKAVSHLATQGDGNHFLFIGESEKTGKNHIVTHHGSRAFGAAVYKKGLHEAAKHCKDITDTKNPWLDYSTDLGKEYWEALQLIKNWTYLNHTIIHNRILDKLKLSPDDFYWNEHNFVFKDDDNKFYHAKGSTPMDSKFNVGQSNYEHRRLIPLNMAQPVLIVENHPDNKTGFAPHGAGRNLSRTAFEKRFTIDNLEKEIKHLDIRFYSGKADSSEYPSAYKNANEVCNQIEKYKLAKIVDKIQPLGCIMAGKQEQIWKKNK